MQQNFGTKVSYLQVLISFKLNFEHSDKQPFLLHRNAPSINKGFLGGKNLNVKFKLGLFFEALLSHKWQLQIYLEIYYIKISLH